jgi:hypothetical protein
MWVSGYSLGVVLLVPKTGATERASLFGERGRKDDVDHI